MGIFRSCCHGWGGDTRSKQADVEKVFMFAFSMYLPFSLFSTAQSMSQEKKDGIPEAFHGFWSIIPPHRLENEYDCHQRGGVVYQ